MALTIIARVAAPHDEMLWKMAVKDRALFCSGQYHPGTGEDYRALKHNGVGGVWALLWRNLSKSQRR